MARYLGRRILSMLPTMLLASMVVFALIQLMPGDVATALLGAEATPEKVAATRRELGLDRPLPVQYGAWLVRALRGDLGRSVRTNERVFEAVAQRIPVTAQLGILSLLIAICLGIPAGVVAAARRNSLSDYAGRVLALSGVAMPDFWLAVLVVFVVALRLRWLPASGFIPFSASPAENLRLMILPAFTLGLGLAAVVMRMTRSSMLDVLQQEYVKVARAKGLPEPAVLRRHALKVAILPVVTVIGLLVGRLVGGVVIIETIFQLPGIGRLAADSIFARDFPMLQGVVIFVITGVLCVNLVIDLCYGYLDPRIRYV